MKQPKSYILIKAISLLLCLLLSSSIFNVIASAVTYSLKVEFEILAINPDNDEYTGPGFDTDGMGFTVYYGDENNLQTVSYSITGNEPTNDKTGMQYAYVSFQGEPRYIEYYSEGTYIGDNENCWDMQAVYLKNTMMWEGSICASAKGVSSYIAKLNLRTGSISRESGNEVAGAWIETSTTYFLKHERIPTKTYITQGNPNYTIGKQPLEKEVWISLTDDFGISYGSEDVASLMKDSLVTVTCNFSESSEGFEFDTWFDYQYVVDYVVEPKSITATIKWVHYSYIDLKLIIHPEAVGDTWDEQTLSFTIKYHDLNSDKEVQFEVPNTITVSDYDVNFTLDANGGYFENGENDVNSITHARKYNNKAGDHPIPVKAGHTFNGYYITKDENLADDISPDSEKLTANTIMAENCTWYASWIKNDYCVTFSYLNENGKRVYDEKFYKYGEEYSAPEIPLEVNYKDDVLFVFTGWSPEFTDTQIMTDANLYYEAQYRTEPYMKLNENNFYEIKTVKQILFFAEKVANGEVYANAILMNDIDLKDVAWTPIENYSGTFDGGNNTIRNLNCVSDDGNVGLFAKVTNGTVKNLHITDSSFQGSESVGAIAGNLSGNIYNCYVDHVTVTGGNSVGALIGTFDSGIAVACHAYDDSLFGSSGNVIISDCYYLSETETDDGGKTAEQFASGEVAYLLQQGNTAQVWGQMSNVDGSFPVLTSKDLYKVIKIDETGNYSVANVGDTNGDGIVDVEDYQALVNMAVSAGHSQTETASYDDIVRYDLNGDGYVDALDAQVMNLVINDMATVDVYAVGDIDHNGIAFEEADIKAIKHAIENPTKLSTAEKYASDINGDGKVDENDLTVLTSKYGEVTGTECADNVKVYYRWGNKYSTCTATAMCTLCGEKVATETVNTTSETLSESTCTQDGKVKYTAIFENELFEEKIKTVTTDMLPHNLSDGVCAVCGLIDAANMTADELETAVAELLLVGKTNITVALAEDAEQEMFSAIRTVFSESTAADGSINLTISGAKTVPDYGFFDIDDYYDNDDKNIAGDKLKSLTLTDVETIGDFAFSACTYLESVNLPQVVTIGECAFNEWKKGTKLTSLDLPNATTIGDWAFAYSSLLTSVNLPKVTSIGVLAFGYCDLRTLDLPEATTIGGEAFMNNYNLVSCSAPKATTVDYYPWGSNGTSKLERLELTAAGDFTLGNNLYAYTPTEQIDLVLNKDKESQVTQNEDGTATWKTTNSNGGKLEYTFKSITFVGE